MAKRNIGLKRVSKRIGLGSKFPFPRPMRHHKTITTLLWTHRTTENKQLVCKSTASRLLITVDTGTEKKKPPILNV